MKIAMVARPHISVPPMKYGGVELVASTLTEELHKRGHDVTLFASGDSVTAAKLIPVQGTSTRKDSQIIPADIEWANDIRSIAKTVDYLANNSFDIIHNHADWYLLPFHNLLRGRLVTTCHLNYKLSSLHGEMLKEFSDLPYVSISEQQRQLLPELNYIRTIHHGLNLESYEFNDTPQDYLCFLGTIRPQKNPIGAIEVAKRTNNRLIIAAKIGVKDVDFYEQEVLPLIDGDQIQFIGEVDLRGKVELLKNAKALLSPITFDEPFGLVNIEALACGTPVISTPRGALPEIVTKDTGYLCSTFEEMCQAVEDIEQIDRKACRSLAQSKFSAQTMTDNYLQLYESLLGA